MTRKQNHTKSGVTTRRMKAQQSNNCEPQLSSSESAIQSKFTSPQFQYIQSKIQEDIKSSIEFLCQNTKKEVSESKTDKQILFSFNQVDILSPDSHQSNVERIKSLPTLETKDHQFPKNNVQSNDSMNAIVKKNISSFPTSVSELDFSLKEEEDEEEEQKDNNEGDDGEEEECNKNSESKQSIESLILKQNTEKDIQRMKVSQDIEQIKMEIQDLFNSKSRVVQLKAVSKTHTELQENISKTASSIDELSTIMCFGLNESFESAQEPSEQIFIKESMQMNEETNSQESDEDLQIESFCNNFIENTKLVSNFVINSEETSLSPLNGILLQLNKELHQVLLKQKEQENTIFSLEKMNIADQLEDQDHDNLNQENALESKQQFQCKFCLKKFIKSCSLGGHISRVHKGKSDQYKEKQKIRENREMERMRKTHFKKKGQMKSKNSSNQVFSIFFEGEESQNNEQKKKEDKSHSTKVQKKSSMKYKNHTQQKAENDEKGNQIEDHQKNEKIEEEVESINSNQENSKSKQQSCKLIEVQNKIINMEVEEQEETRNSCNKRIDDKDDIKNKNTKKAKPNRMKEVKNC